MPHINRLIDFVVAAFIVHNKKVLLVEHKKLKAWLPVGGHIELDEDPIQALKREVVEETGLNLKITDRKVLFRSKGTKSLRVPNFLDIHKITDSHRHIGIIYFLRSEEEKIKLAEREHNSIKWFSESELNRKEYKIKSSIKFYCREAIRSIG